MKQTHRPDILTWSIFDTTRNLDFNGYVWTRAAGNVLIDPVPLGEHDRAHLDQLGGAAFIVVTNSDHTRQAAELAEALGARIIGPEAERGVFEADIWVGESDEPVPGLCVHTLDGSKTPGELALRLEETLIFGDLVRGHVGGRLNLLPPQKLSDPVRARSSIRRLVSPGVEAVLVGDGWSVFRDGAARLAEIA